MTPLSSTAALEHSPTSSFVCGSAVMQRTWDLAVRAAQGDAKILLTGESGVGKELFARLIHARSRRATRPLLTVNCAAFADGLLESELFGHVKGSFTGAYRDKVGKLRQADGGTIFLDEIGEMPPRMQALLLRFLENGELQPVGSDRPEPPADVRVISATNRNLHQMTAAGTFRTDLLYRLRVVHIEIPPLRERREDIAPLVEQIAGRRGASKRFTAAAIAALEAYDWPGNVRELQNVIEQATWMAAGNAIDAADLPASVQAAGNRPLAPARERRRQVADELYSALREGRLRFWEQVRPLFLSRDLTRQDVRGVVRRALAAAGGDYRRAIALIGVDEADYKPFLNFLACHGCSVDRRAFRGEAAAKGVPEEPVRPLLPAANILRFPAAR